MEQVGNQALNPHLQRVLKSFQTAAVRTLSGPSGLPILNDFSKMSASDLEDYRKAVIAVGSKNAKREKGVDYDPFLAPPPFPIQQMPVFTPVDNSRSEKSETILEGEFIACFDVGGEKRLCLPQILNTVLRNFSLQQINAVCDELHIFCSRCNPEQLETLKVTAILPLSAPSCGLITKTDAERLCNALLHRSPERSVEPPSPNSFKVYHECFGKCKGVFNPDLYNSPKAKCIQCADCQGLFSPSKFVCHSHKALENKTCHWGFDSANWRSYLLLAKDQDSKEKIQEALEQMKSRFDPTNKYKRKESPDPDSSDPKRLKVDDTPSPSALGWVDGTTPLRVMSAFQPWSPSVLSAMKEGKLLPAPPAIMREGLPAILPPYLHTGPPVLLNPERVVPYSESERYERHFTPNVALAPVSQRKSKDDGCEDIPAKSSLLLKASDSLDHKPSPPREYREYDLPTDTDDSSIGQPSPSDEPGLGTDSPHPQSTLEAELEMIRRALDGKVPNTREAHDHFLHEFSKLRIQQEELLNALIQSKKSLKQELGSYKGRYREASDKKRSLSKEVERIRIESECRLQEAEETREKLMEEITRLNSKEDGQRCDKCVHVSHDLKARLQHFESLYHDLQEENQILRNELKSCGIKVNECLSKHKKKICNGNYPLETKSLSPKKGSEGSPTRASDSAASGWLPKLLPPKKEWESSAE